MQTSSMPSRIKPAQAAAPDASVVEAVRGFNRYYTQKIGVLQQGLLQSPWSLSEARVLWELAQRDGSTASELKALLQIDPGYLSRILQRFQAAGLLRSSPSTQDGRRRLLRLTAKGRKAYATLDARSREDVTRLLQPLPAGGRESLLRAMHTIRTALGGGAAAAAQGEVKLREHRVGDLSLIVHRQALLYAQEYGWNMEFEALIAEIAAKFLRNFKPGRERCWVAERGGELLGAVFLVERSKTCAQLRMLHVEQGARGQGIGARLVRECTQFARAAGYRKIMLWTNSVLSAARHLYVNEGYRLVKEEPHHHFGKALVGQNWELKL